MIPNYASVVQHVYATGSFDLSTREGCGAFTEACALALHALNAEFGHLQKQPEQNQWNGHALDAVLYKATGQTVDLILSAPSPASVPQWSVHEDDDYPPALWIDPTDLAPVDDRPYDEAKAVAFGLGCNDAMTAWELAHPGKMFPRDPGMIAVHAQRAAFDYYTGLLPWDASLATHLNDYRAEYGLPPLA